MKPLSLLPLTVALALLPGGASAAPGPEQDPAAASTTQAPPTRPLVQGGLGFVMGLPIGDFQENVDFSAGAAFQIDFGIANSPVSLGVEGTYLGYGSESWDVPLVGLPGLTVGVDTSNDMFLFHGRVRVQKPDGHMRPYMVGLLGFNYLWTATTVDAEDTCTSTGTSTVCTNDGDSLTHLDDLVLSAGGGLGVQIAFGSRPSPTRLDLSVRYLYGGKATYLTEGDIVWREEGVTLLSRQSRTDMLMVYIGLAWGR